MSSYIELAVTIFNSGKKDERDVLMENDHNMAALE